VVARWQLLELEMSARAIEHRIATGRLHPMHRGVYAAGRRELTRNGQWMAAVLASGRSAVLSHESAAALGICRNREGPIEVSMPASVFRRSAAIRAHRRTNLASVDIVSVEGIPVTSSIRTLIDLAGRLPSYQLEAAVSKAGKLDLVDPETLRSALDERAGQPGVRPLRALLDRHTFRLTESELERRFLRIVRQAGLPLPDTQVELAGRVDFHWDELGLVVETDGWRYHRTPAQQARDNRRMQDHVAAGRTAIRFSHHEIRYEPRRVASMLVRTARRLRP
jgi:very-short-patch-repair endonuclease